MSWSGDQSPSPKNSPDWHQRGNYGNFRSPYPSPRNGQNFDGPSPMKNFDRRNNVGYNRFQNDRYHYSPSGNRRGGGRGGYRGRGGFRGSPGDSADISSYVNPSMLDDPWKELEDNLGLKVTSLMSHSCEVSTNRSVSTSLNSSASEDTKENVTEESVVLSDDSSGDVVVTTLPHEQPSKTNMSHTDPSNS